jgi:hypothetical protein
MKMFLIRADLAQALADYLALRPYREVAQLIDGLQRLEEPAEDKPIVKDTLRKAG